MLKKLIPYSCSMILFSSILGSEAKADTPVEIYEQYVESTRRALVHLNRLERKLTSRSKDGRRVSRRQEIEINMEIAEVEAKCTLMRLEAQKHLLASLGVFIDTSGVAPDKLAAIEAVDDRLVKFSSIMQDTIKFANNFQQSNQITAWINVLESMGYDELSATLKIWTENQNGRYSAPMHVSFVTKIKEIENNLRIDRARLQKDRAKISMQIVSDQTIGRACELRFFSALFH